MRKEKIPLSTQRNNRLLRGKISLRRLNLIMIIIINVAW